MAEHDIGAVLVLDNNRLVGILMGHFPKETSISEIMTTLVVFVSPQHTVDECTAMMTEHRIRHLPVFENGAVVAVISIGDLVKWIASGHARAIQDLEGYITGIYPA